MSKRKGRSRKVDCAMP
jgi:hypothetical protein